MNDEEFESAFGDLAFGKNWRPKSNIALPFDNSTPPNRRLLGRLFLKEYGPKLQSATCSESRLRTEISAGLSIATLATKIGTGTITLPVSPEDAAAILIKYGLDKFCKKNFVD